MNKLAFFVLGCSVGVPVLLLAVIIAKGCPSRHDGGIEFEIRAGTTYHFDYWGP